LKLAASDFDGTLFIKHEIVKETVEAILSWRQAGHKFGVITGRDYGMLLPQLKFFGIESDFSICNNGAIIFSGNGTVLYQAKIQPSILYDLATHQCLADSLHVAFSQADQTFVYQAKADSWIVREGKQWNFPVQMIEAEKISSLRDVQQISLGFSQQEQAAQAAAQLNLLFGDNVQACQNRGSVDITPLGIDKSTGIEMLLQIKQWEQADVYVIGDESNDLSMICKFGGYAMASARDLIQRQAKKSFISVGSMLREYR